MLCFEVSQSEVTGATTRLTKEMRDKNANVLGISSHLLPFAPDTFPRNAEVSANLLINAILMTVRVL